MRTLSKRQRGVALLTAVMVVAFASTLTTALMVAQNLAVHRAANMRSLDAAWWYLIGLEEWAGTILRRDAQDSSIDTLDEIWAQRIDFLPVDEGVLAGQIVDLHSQFNLNTLGVAEPEQVLLQFNRLLAAIPELRDQAVGDLGVRIADWIDPDTEPRFPGGAEDQAYLSLDPPRRAANRPMVSITELRLIDGVTEDIYAALVPHVTVAPAVPHPINVNTATPAVLQSLAEGLTPGDVESLLASREESPWESLENFRAEPALAARPVSENIDVRSSYFRAEGSADVQGVRLQLVSVLHRGSDGRARTVWRSRAPY